MSKFGSTTRTKPWPSTPRSSGWSSATTSRCPRWATSAGSRSACPAQPDVAITLMAVPGPPVFDAETRDQIKALMAKGAATGLFFATDDCQASYKELKGHGVEFQQEPTEQPYGIDAGFRDPSGNQMRMVQSK